MYSPPKNNTPPSYLTHHLPKKLHFPLPTPPFCPFSQKSPCTEMHFGPEHFFPFRVFSPPPKKGMGEVLAFSFLFLGFEKRNVGGGWWWGETGGRRSCERLRCRCWEKYKGGGLMMDGFYSVLEFFYSFSYKPPPLIPDLFFSTNSHPHFPPLPLFILPTFYSPPFHQHHPPLSTSDSPPQHLPSEIPKSQTPQTPIPAHQRTPKIAQSSDLCSTRGEKHTPKY